MTAQRDAKADFGQKVYDLRRARDLSLQDVADALAAISPEVGRSRQAVSNWEAGLDDPGREVIAALESVLNAPGELLPILGYSLTDINRLEALEQDMEYIKGLIAEISRQLDEISRQLDER